MNSQFIDKEFSGMMFNPTKAPEGTSVFKAFPELKKYKSFQKSAGETIDNEMLMKWIFCMYDKNTPYRNKYKDVLKRKVEVAHDVGFEMIGNGKFVTPVEDFMKGENNVVNLKITEFVRLHKSFKYSYFVGIENSYYKILLDVIGGETKRIKELKEMGEELEETLLAMLNEDDNPHLKETVLRYIEEERLALRPEDIAIKLSKGERPITD